MAKLHQLNLLCYCQQPYKKALNLHRNMNKRTKWKKLTDSITRCIAEDCLPMNVVEGAGFKNMINAFDSRYKIPGRNHFSKIHSITKSPCFRLNKMLVPCNISQPLLICGLAWICNHT